MLAVDIQDLSYQFTIWKQEFEDLKTRMFNKKLLLKYLALILKIIF